MLNWAKVIAAEVEAKVPIADRLPAGIRFHDGRRYLLASLLIRNGADVVQARLRHASTKTDTYGHLWPDTDNSTRAAINDVIAAQMPAFADYLRTTSEVS